MRSVLPRIAYGEAASLIQVARFDHAWGRIATRIENQGEKILAEVVSRIGNHHLDMLKEGIKDALAGRRARW